MADGKWEIYKDEGGKHRWRLKASNGKIVASSGESFSTKYSAEIGIISAQNAAKSTEVVDLT